MDDVTMTRSGEFVWQLRAESPKAVRQFKRMAYPPVVGVCDSYAIFLIAFLRKEGLICRDEVTL